MEEVAAAENRDQGGRGQRRVGREQGDGGVGVGGTRLGFEPGAGWGGGFVTGWGGGRGCSQNISRGYVTMDTIFESSLLLVQIKFT
jgi:hypothetical protein